MRNLDDELKKVLPRVEPPAGFAERVLRRTKGQGPVDDVDHVDPVRPFELVTAPPRPVAQRPASPWYRLAAAAALIAAFGGGAMEYRAVQKERAERMAGEAAGVKVVQALQIAGSKLQIVQAKINQLHEQPEKKSNQ